MAKTACKCKKPGECEECPEWIFTFADLVMLMMGFFVILWVLKPSANPTSNPQLAEEQDQRWLEQVAAIRQQFGYVPDPKSRDPVDLLLINGTTRTAPHPGPGDGGQTTVPRKGVVGTDPYVTSIRPGSRSLVGGRIFFDAGSAELTTEGKHQLDDIFPIIHGYTVIVLIKGHAAVDDFPQRDPQKEMDLSMRRAQAAANYLIDKGISPEILRIEACSTFEPVAEQAYTAEAQVPNRRVEVEATDTLVSDVQGEHPPTTQVTAPIPSSSPRDPSN